MTHNLSSRGAYFRTFDGAPFRVGLPIVFEISVPHRLATDGREVMLDFRGLGRVVRIEDPQEHRAFGENGTPLTGVAIQFADPLRFEYAWV